VHALESIERLALLLEGLPGLNEGPHLWASAPVRWKWNLRPNKLPVRFRPYEAPFFRSQVCIFHKQVGGPVGGTLCNMARDGGYVKSTRDPVRLNGKSCRAESKLFIKSMKVECSHLSTRKRTSAKKAGSRLMQYDCSLHALS
jgi:hypothetical protein